MRSIIGTRHRLKSCIPLGRPKLDAGENESYVVKEPEVCGCVADPFAAVPPEMQPRPKKKGSLHKVDCPRCGKEYWTNRETDLCLDCERSRDHKPVSQD